MSAVFPRVVPSGDRHCIIHKVATVAIDSGGVLRFSFQKGDGTPYYGGPGYLMVNGRLRLAADELARCGLQSPDEINYVVAHHCGALPCGRVVFLLRSLDDLPDCYRKGVL